MADASDIAAVRLNTNEPDATTFSDEAISALVDELGVAGASASIWGVKAGSYSELVDVTEAGASHKFSDLHKNALAMQKFWDGQALLLVTPLHSGRPKVRKIERS
jgi:hypothetical protein